MVEVRRETVQLSSRAYEMLKDAIVSLRLRPGQALVERVLADSLDMSPTPIREALQRLEHEGLVTRTPFKGACVSGICLADLEEIFELRELLEARCARISATGMSDGDLRELRELLTTAEGCMNASDTTGYADALWQFHDLLMRCVRNRRLVHTLTDIRAQARRIGAVTAYVPGRSEKSIGEHRALLGALERRDPDLSEKLMIEHTRTLLADLRKDYQQGGVSATFLVSSTDVANLLQPDQSITDPLTLSA
jgi:DNA-binding GntR family transcriptional regulator